MLKEIKGNPTVQMVLDHYGDQVGWDSDSEKLLLIEFIESQGVRAQEEFKQFVHDKADQEYEGEEDLDEEDEEEGEEELEEDEDEE